MFISSLNSASHNNLFNCPKKITWKHKLIEFFSLETKMEPIRRKIFQDQSADYSKGDSERMSKMASAAQNNIDATIDSNISKIHEVNPHLANTFKTYFPRTYKVASCLSSIVQYLLLLPFKSAKNIAHMIYQTLKAVTYAIIHPVQAAKDFLQALIKLAEELKKPETWVRPVVDSLEQVLHN